MISFSKEECNRIINLTQEIEGIHRDGNSTNVERPRDKISYTYYNIFRNEKMTRSFKKCIKIKFFKKLKLKFKNKKL